MRGTDRLCTSACTFRAIAQSDLAAASMLEIVGVAGGIAMVGYAVIHGHSKALSDVVVGSVLAILGSVFLVLEMVHLLSYPVRKAMRKPAIDSKTAMELASGKMDIAQRKVVIFDGVCVLCNRAGQFVVMHLPDPNLVAFVPFQDAISSHVSMAKIRDEFPDFKDEDLQLKIAVVSGKRLLWGADAVIEICSWMSFPFPLMKLGLLMPKPMRDVCYYIVSANRYDWFGTQPLENNFAKSLCPYLAVQKYLKKED